MKTSPYKINNFSRWNVLKVNCWCPERHRWQCESEGSSICNPPHGRQPGGSVPSCWKHSQDRFQLLCLVFTSFLRLQQTSKCTKSKSIFQQQGFKAQGIFSCFFSFLKIYIYDKAYQMLLYAMVYFHICKIRPLLL